MSKEYSWKDGWALTYPHPLPKPVPLLELEKVYRCKCTGNYVYLNNDCLLCGQTMEAINDNT